MTGRADKAFFDAFRFLAGGITGLVSALQVRSARGMILAGTVTFLVTLYSGFWSTYAYIAAIAPVICWHLDDWLGFGDRRVRWPNDPVGEISDRVDARWPIRT
jgi:hypothetical protein